jgi:hypothetical protein
METKISKYQMVQTGRYNGQFQIIQGWENTKGDFRPNFISKRQKDGTDKAYPASITFESDEVAIAFLRSCLAELKAEEAPF